MDRNGVIGIPASRYDAFDFIIVPTTHLHIKNFTIPEEKLLDSAYRAEKWVWRFDRLLDSSLPMHKVGVPHITSGLINNTAPRAEALQKRLLQQNDVLCYRKSLILQCILQRKDSFT